MDGKLFAWVRRHLIATAVIGVGLLTALWWFTVAGAPPSPEPASVGLPEPAPTGLSSPATSDREARRLLDRYRMLEDAKYLVTTDRSAIGGADQTAWIEREQRQLRLQMEALGVDPSSRMARSSNATEPAFEALSPLEIVYNKPDTLPFAKPSQLMASVASHSVQQAFARVQRGQGPPAKGRGGFRRRVRAQLEGAGDLVTIEPQGSPVRAIDSSANTTWTWFVTRKTLQPFELTLSFYNVVDEQGGEVDGPVFTSTYKVKAGALDKLGFYGSRASPFWTAAVAIVTALAGAWGWFKARGSGATLSAATKRSRRPRR